MCNKDKLLGADPGVSQFEREKKSTATESRDPKKGQQEQFKMHWQVAANGGGYLSYLLNKVWISLKHHVNYIYLN